jgi:hypothetical protein
MRSGHQYPESKSRFILKNRHESGALNATMVADFKAWLNKGLRFRIRISKRGFALPKFQSKTLNNMAS